MSRSHQHDKDKRKRKKRREHERRRSDKAHDVDRLSSASHVPSAPPLETGTFGAKQFSQHDEHLDSKPTGLTMQQHRQQQSKAALGGSAGAPPPLYMQAQSTNANANAAGAFNADVDLAAGQPRRHLPARRAGRESCCDRWCDANMIVFWPDCYDCWWLSWHGMWECCDGTCVTGACGWPRLGGNCDTCRNDDSHVICCDCDWGVCDGCCNDEKCLHDWCNCKCCGEGQGGCCEDRFDNQDCCCCSCCCDGCGRSCCECGDCNCSGCDCNC